MKYKELRLLMVVLLSISIGELMVYFDWIPDNVVRVAPTLFVVIIAFLLKLILATIIDENNNRHNK